MKILSAEQIRALDAYTIKEEPITSIDLMERASLTFVNWFIEQFPDEDIPVQIFCGIGNNGGDGLAIARLLHQRFYNVEIVWCRISLNTSEDFAVNLKRLPKRKAIPLTAVKSGDPMPEITANTILIDAIFGSGLNRAVEGYWAELIEWINEQSNTVVSVDIPSGLFADQHTSTTCIKADYSFSFELPKLAFLFPENQNKVGHWISQSIGLHKGFLNDVQSNFHYVDQQLARSLLKVRSKFDHKGTYGHALLIMGSYGKVGAAVLAAKACLRIGAGLVTVHAPSSAYQILQISVPEAMVSIDEDEHYFSATPDLKPYKAIAVGCGLDKQKITTKALKMLLEQAKQPLVLDADALNILSEHQSWYLRIPKGSILTPHPKEFERLFGKTANDFERNQVQREQAKALESYIILKGAHTCIACPDGSAYFNSTGNPGMATAGSGDVLSGIISGLMAMTYSSFEASVLGVYLHGLAGDEAAQEIGQESMLASDIIQYLGTAYRQLRLA